MNAKQTTAVIGSALLMVGIFLPVISVPIAGDFNLFQNGHGDGAILLGVAALSIVFAFTDLMSLLWITGLCSFAVTLYDFVNAIEVLSHAKTEMDQILEGNIFKGIVDVGLDSVQLQWGWAVVIIGSCLLLAAAAIPVAEDELALEQEMSGSIPVIVFGLLAMGALGGVAFLLLNGGKDGSSGASRNSASTVDRIRSQLYSKPDFRKLDIRVTENKDEISLSGIVPSDAVRLRVYELAKNIAGEEVVDDELTVAEFPAQIDSGPGQDFSGAPEENREQRLIQAFCGNASDLDSCMKRELPGFGDIKPQAGPPNFSNREVFEAAKVKCLPLFGNDTQMLVYCVDQLYEGIMVSRVSGSDAASH